MASDEWPVRVEPTVREVAQYLLAGGASRRFGRDKALVELGGKPMLARMLEVIAGAAGASDGARRGPFVVGDAEEYRRFGVPCIADRWPGEGPLGGIVTVLLHARETAPRGDWNLVVSCDMPFLTADWLRFLAERAAKSAAEVVVPHSRQGPEPLCACWRTEAAEILRTGFERGVRKVTEGIGLLRAEVLDESEWTRFDSAGRLFWNMNTRRDYEEARRIVETDQGRVTEAR